MTGAEEVAEARKWRQRATKMALPEETLACLAYAQYHATMAQTAAIVECAQFGHSNYGREKVREWERVIGS